MSWNQSPMPGGPLADIKDALTAITDSMKAILEVQKVSAEISKVLAGPPNVLLEALIAACDLVLIELNALKSGGYASIFCHPWHDGVVPAYDKPTGMLKLSTPRNLGYVDRAFDDPKDDERPTGTGEWGSLFFVIATSNITGFKTAIEKLGAFFSITAIDQLIARIDKIEQDKTSIDSEAQVPKEIDFEGKSQAEFFPELEVAIFQAIGTVEGIKKLGEKDLATAEAALEFMDEQILAFEDLTNTWVAAIDKFNLSIEDVGIYWRFWDSQPNGLATIRADLKNTSEWPPIWSTSQFTASYGLFGGASIGVLKTILGI